MRPTIPLRVCLTVLLVAVPIVLLAAPGEEFVQDTPKRFAPVLKPFVDSGSLAGAVVLVPDKDKVLTTETVGYADVGAKRSMLADMLFWIASQTKPITAAALMMLVDEGKVGLDDPV